MLKSKSNFDHFLVIGDRAKTGDLLRGLGFVYGNTKNDSLIHVVLNHGYFEIMDFSASKTKTDTKSEIGGWWMGTTDVKESREIMAQAGYDVSDLAIADGFRRAKHGVNTGMAGFASYSLSAGTPYEKYAMGVVQGLTPKLTYDQQLFIQVNGARAMDGVVIVGQDEKAVQEAHDFHVNFAKLTARVAANNTNMRVNYYITREEYKKMFGKEYDGGKKLDICAAVFEGGDMVYLKEQAETLGLNYTVKGMDICIDATEVLACFLIFHCDPLYDVNDLAE